MSDDFRYKILDMIPHTRPQSTLSYVTKNGPDMEFVNRDRKTYSWHAYCNSTFISILLRFIKESIFLRMFSCYLCKTGCVGDVM